MSIIFELECGYMQSASDIPELANYKLLEFFGLLSER